jgi:hypothetical protein
MQCGLCLRAGERKLALCRIFARGAGILREVLDSPFELSFLQPLDL